MNQKKLSILLAIFIAGVAVYTRTARILQYHVVLNDFWTVFYYARNINPSIPASLHNSLFPIGYAAILRLMPIQHALRMAFYLNVILASLAVTAASATALTHNNIPRAILVALIAIFFPLTFLYANTTGPDIGVATFTALGLYFLWINDLHENPSSPAYDILAGISLGLASLWRSHAIVAGIAFLAAYAGVMGVKTLWQRRKIVIAFLGVAGIQVLINIIAGHGAVENAQYFNIYKTFFGSNWLVVPKDANQNLLFNLLLTQPVRILKDYMPHLWDVLIYAWATIPLFMISRNKTLKRFAVFALFAILLYAIPVAFGSSPRAPIAITPLAFTAFGFLISESYSRLQTSRGLSLMALILFSAVLVSSAFQWYQINTEFIAFSASEHDRYVRIENRLLNKGLKSPDEIFTNRYNFYLPDVPPYQPRSNGGWDTSILWNYRTEYPELPVGSWDEFSSACKDAGIHFLVLTPYSYEVAPFFGGIYKGKFKPDNIEVLHFNGNYQIIRFK